jgi:hypothetical protein
MRDSAAAAPLDVEHSVAFPLGKSKVNGEKGLFEAQI